MPRNSVATPKLRQIDLAWPMCRYPFGSGGKRVATRPPFFPTLMSSLTIVRMKSSGWRFVPGFPDRLRCRLVHDVNLRLYKASAPALPQSAYWPPKVSLEATRRSPENLTTTPRAHAAVAHLLKPQQRTGLDSLVNVLNPAPLAGIRCRLSSRAPDDDVSQSVRRRVTCVQDRCGGWCVWHCCVVALPRPARAQGTSASIQGSVIDDAGPLPGATIVAKDTQSGFSMTRSPQWTAPSRSPACAPAPTRSPSR